MVKMTIAGGSGAGTYLMTWNGHGDATSLNLLNGDGSLTLANSYSYSSWGTPSTTSGGIGDLGFRFLYVGSGDVQWDNDFGLGLEYMHARHYAPAGGRFLQPDPSPSDANPFAYANSSPVTEADPSGLYGILNHNMNADENRLCRASYWRCAIATSTAGLATAMSVVFYSNQEADAMRHCTWAALMTSIMGRWWADQWGRAHETGDEGNTPWDSRMDYHNNAVGQNIGSTIWSIWSPIIIALQACNTCSWSWHHGRLYKTRNQQVYFSNGRRAPVVDPLVPWLSGWFGGGSGRGGSGYGGGF